LHSSAGYHQPSEVVIRNSIQQTIACEAAGYSTALVCRAPFQQLQPGAVAADDGRQHCAGLTKTIRLGTACACCRSIIRNACSVRSDSPTSVSNGRLDLGVGSGYQQFEFERFGTNVENAPAVFSEHLEIIEKGLNQKIFTHEGKFHKIPPTAIAVRTNQKPRVPIWLAAGSPRSMGRAYRGGHNLFVTALQDGLDTIRTLRAQIEQAAAGEKKQVTDARSVFCVAVTRAIIRLRSITTSIARASSAASRRRCISVGSRVLTAIW
jgi:alkanesulfonate monooxygenase SsuD/methylene tetrahydromethanopterin reductase-like flavin-dependent oxidoreductase (luciferase family)